MQRVGRFGVNLLFLVSAIPGLAADASLPIAAVNDNRIPGGQLKNGALELRLELRATTWYPEEEGGKHREVYAFGEEGRTPQIPGPLLRVPTGTEIHAAVRNMLPKGVKIYGLHRHPGDAKDALALGPGEMRELRFVAGEPGTYYYWASTDKHLKDRPGVEMELSGGFIVDPVGSKPDDRILVLGLWGAEDLSQQIPTINGKAWPHTERMTFQAGDAAVHWRVINPTFDPHGMHLHGFYFTVTGAGDGEHYEVYSEDQRRKAVTEFIDVGHVFDMTWKPDRAGNWLFHCHMLLHMSPAAAPPSEAGQPAAYSDSAHDHIMGMYGLVIGITVLPDATHAATSPQAVSVRKLQLVISENPSKIPLYSLAVNDPAKPPAPDEKNRPGLLGPPIVLTRGEPTEIEVRNHSGKPTSIHWHGIELESYYDGVVGWAGSGQQTSPPVVPGASFLARMTPPRAGTFIYHTHWHDSEQLLNGLYGPLIVLEPGQKYDPEHDIAVVISVGKYAPFGFLMLVNGHPQPDPIKLHTATRYRLRLINITDNGSDVRLRLTVNDVPVQWRIVAKDGADLPSAQLKSSTADMPFVVGETYDVEYESASPSLANLEALEPPFPPAILPLQFDDAK